MRNTQHHENVNSTRFLSFKTTSVKNNSFSIKQANIEVYLKKQLSKNSQENCNNEQCQSFGSSRY
jgi:hypothetical protein